MLLAVGLSARGRWLPRAGEQPDRADACVWALSELLLKQRAEPRIRALW